LVVAECVCLPDTTIATVAFGTTAPEGSVTCPRKVPAVVGDGACACADAGAASPISVAKIRIARMTTDNFNTHLFFPGRSNRLRPELRPVHYCAASPSPPDVFSDHGESNVDAL